MLRPTENIELTPVTLPRPVEVNLDADERPPSPRTNNAADELTYGELTGQGLAPTDGGPAAWRLLVAAFVFEALLWGNQSSQFWAESTELTRIQPRLPFVFRSVSELLFACSRVCW